MSRTYRRHDDEYCGRFDRERSKSVRAKKQTDREHYGDGEFGESEDIELVEPDQRMSGAEGSDEVEETDR